MSYHLQVMSPTRADVGKSISKSKRGNSVVDLTQKDDNMDGTNIGRSSLGSGGNPAPRKISKNQKDTASSSVVQSQSPILAFGALASPKPAEKERSKNRSPRRPAPRRLELFCHQGNLDRQKHQTKKFDHCTKMKQKKQHTKYCGDNNLISS